MNAKLLSDRQLANEATTEVAATLRIGWIASPMTLEAIDFYMDSSIGEGLEGLAPQVGLEPTTLRLTAECSTIELLRSIGNTSRRKSRSGSEIS
jgi:hypothetical protein